MPFSSRALIPLSSLLCLTFGSSASIASDNFDQCKVELQQQAIDKGIREDIATDAFANIQYSARVIELDRSQPEFVQTFTGYFSKRVTDWRVDKGRELLAKHKSLLTKLGKQYGVPPHYLVSFWGLETNFGSYKGKMSVLDSLTTLACDPRRSDYFTQELMVALQLMQRESLSPEQLIGSWAGAMGHTQFMPSAYLNYAIDGDADGKVNLWDSESDALTSAANFLNQLGWKAGFRWGREVQLPKNFDYNQAGYSQRRSLSEWSALGVTKANGHALGENDLLAYVVVPAGHEGPAFLAYDNFRVIMRWNNSEFYALAVGHLADRIAGAGELSVPLPQLPQYSRDDIIALQQQLNHLGIDVGKPDGIIGPATRSGIRVYQKNNNMVADGFPSLAVMQQMGIVTEG